MSGDIPDNFKHLRVHREGRILNEIDNPPINLITIPLLLDFINLTKWAQDDEESTVLVLRSNVEGFLSLTLMLKHFSQWIQVGRIPIVH